MSEQLERAIDIMQVLKENTREQHQSVEGLMPFFRPGFSLEVYEKVLEALLGFFEPMENVLRSVAGWGDAGIDIHHRSRSYLIHSDLSFLGKSSAQIAQVARCRELPQFEDLTGAMGALYVLEGSTLGGQVISTELQRTLGLQAGSGLSFFSSEGRNIGREWRTLCAAMRNLIGSPEQSEIAVRVAENTFVALENWLRKAGFSE